MCSSPLCTSLVCPCVSPFSASTALALELLSKSPSLLFSRLVFVSARSSAPSLLRGQHCYSRSVKPSYTYLTRSHECVFTFPFNLVGALDSFERPEGSSNSTDHSSPPKFLPYNYVPTEWVCITFLALFGFSTCKAPPISPANFEPLTWVVIRFSTPYCTSNTFASLVVIPHCSSLRYSRVLRLERSTVVESQSFHKEAIYHTVSKMQ